MLGTQDLVLCAGTVLHTPLAERVKAAASAGFTALSLWAEDYEQARAAGLTDGDLRSMLADHGLTIAELDGLSRWLPASGEDDIPFGRREEEFYAIADALGAAEATRALRAKAGI